MGNLSVSYKMNETRLWTRLKARLLKKEIELKSS